MSLSHRACELRPTAKAGLDDPLAGLRVVPSVVVIAMLVRQLDEPAFAGPIFDTDGNDSAGSRDGLSTLPTGDLEDHRAGAIAGAVEQGQHEVILAWAVRDVEVNGCHPAPPT